MTSFYTSRSEALATMGIEEGFISYSVNVRFEDGVALGLPGITIGGLATEWAQVLRESFPDAIGVGVIRYGRAANERATAEQLTAAVKAWVLDARETGRLADRDTLRALGYWLSWNPDTNPAAEG